MPQPTEYPLPRFIMLEIASFPGATYIEKVEIALVDKKNGCKLDFDVIPWGPHVRAAELSASGFIYNAIERFKEDLRNHGVY